MQFVSSTNKRKKRKIWIACVLGIILIIVSLCVGWYFISYSKQNLIKYPGSVWTCEDPEITITVQENGYIHFESGNEGAVWKGYVESRPYRICFTDRSYDSTILFMGSCEIKNHGKVLLVEVQSSNCTLVQEGQTLRFTRQN